jgi:toxin HigB-1
VRVSSIAHKGIRHLYIDGSTKGLPSSAVEKIRKMLAFLEAMTSEDELRSLPIWNAHLLSGDRKGTWSLTVTRNWRLTFSIDPREAAICGLDFEDYH